MKSTTRFFLILVGAATSAALCRASRQATPCAHSHACTDADAGAGWIFKGPSTYYARGDDLKITSAGATQTAVAGAGGSWFIGTVNGGVWKTSDLSKRVPEWENVLDGQPVTCSSIAAMHVSTQNPNIVYAGCGGSTSSEQGSDWNVLNSGDWAGVMKSADGGKTWRMLRFPVNWYVTSILEISSTNLLVSAQSHLYDANKGGIWKSTDGGATFQQVSELPTFTLSILDNNQILATHARDAKRSVSVSSDGDTWNSYGAVPWEDGMIPFYTCATVVQVAGESRVVVAGLTVKSDDPTTTSSAFFIRTSNGAWESMAQPTSMDEDSMPKDRMAILGDPEVRDLMYVAGNAGALAWRVNMSAPSGPQWTKMWDSDVTDGSLPHGDCRNYAWDADTGRLVLVSDGGIFARIRPRASGGRWVSLNGNVKQMEYLSAHYDNREDRFVAGAQDNCAQVFPPNAQPSDVAIGFVEGDGTVTLVDNVHNPARLYGTTQFLGVGTIDIDPSDDDEKDDGEKDDDDDCGGLCFAQGDKFIGVPLSKYFPEPSTFPYFVQPYALNAQDPSKLYFWTNGTAARKSAFYRFSIGEDVKSSDDIPPPELVLETPDDAFFLDFVSGGYTDQAPDPELVVGISSSHLYISQKGEPLTTWSLPTTFATPVTLGYDDKGARILGPVTHGRTVSLAVSPSDSNVIAVTGWPSVSSNEGVEQVFITVDGGASWTNVTGNLREQTGVAGKVRPGGLLLVDLLENHQRALLVGTSNGVMVTYVPLNGEAGVGNWTRFGTCAEFPIVLTAALSYEHYSDTLVAATFGRGIYALHNAKASLLRTRSCSFPWLGKPVPEESSARFFPKQH